MNRILNRHPFLWDTGTLYKKTILQDPHINPFWKEIFDMWYIYADNFIPKSTIDILNEPMWYNNKLTNKFPFIPGWAKHNVLKIEDLLNINGEFNFNHFKFKFNILGTFLDYNRILASIPQEWKTIINNEKQHIAECTVYIPSPLKFLLQQKKGCKRVYNVLSNITNIHIKAFDKWGEILNNDYNSITIHCAIQYGCTKDTKLLQLQYKLLHRILPTNKWLKKIGIVLEDTCAFCNTETESLEHVFLECTFVTSFWSEVLKWLEKYQLWRQVLLSNEEILLGFKGGKYTLLNLIILSTKHYIYCCKCQHRRPLFNNLYSYLKRIFTLEEYTAKTTNKYEVFLGKWNVVFHDLKNYGVMGR